MRTSMINNPDCIEMYSSSYVYEIFSEEEIPTLFELMSMVHKFYSNIGDQDRTKPQAIRAAGGFLQVAPPSTPPEIILSLVETLEAAMKARNAKLVWNGAKSCEYFFINDQTVWLDLDWTNRLFRALSYGMKNNKNNKVKINCLSALSRKRIQAELLNRPEHLVQVFHDCVDVAAEVPHLDTKFQEIDYHAKLRDMCCQSIIALSKKDNRMIFQIIGISSTLYIDI